jgi:hypothetical protein
MQDGHVAYLFKYAGCVHCALARKLPSWNYSFRGSVAGLCFTSPASACERELTRLVRALGSVPVASLWTLSQFTHTSHMRGYSDTVCVLPSILYLILSRSELKPTSKDSSLCHGKSSLCQGVRASPSRAYIWGRPAHQFHQIQVHQSVKNSDAAS